MAKVKASILWEGVTGTIGKSLVLRQMRDGRIILSAKPDFSHRKLSQKQLSHQRRFREATVYARGAAKTTPIYQELAEGTAKTAYNIALADWFNPPVIRRIQWRNDCIHIEAWDAVLVTRVTVKIVDPDGKIREQGNAVLVHAPIWEYATTQTTGTVMAAAYDLAGNCTTQEMLAY